jgi:hypothetical protein
MQVFKDGQVAHYKTMFPNTSFPASGPSDKFLNDNNAKKVCAFLPHDRETQKLVRVDPYPHLGLIYTVEVAELTAEEIAANTASKAAKLRAARDRELARSDWRVIKAQETGVALDEDWSTYRQTLRDISDAEGFPNIDLPTAPDYVPLNTGTSV